MIQISIRGGEVVLSISGLLEGAEGECQFLSLKTSESFLGTIPTAELMVKCQQDVADLLSKIDISIAIEAYKIDFSMYVYAIQFLNDTCLIKLMSYDPTFIRETHNNKFTNIKEAVQALSPVNIVTNTESDLLNDAEVFQIMQTDYKLLSKLLQCWKKNTIFSYCIDGIRLLDLNNYEAIDSSILLRANATAINQPEISEPKLYSLDTSIINYSNDKDETHSYVQFSKQYIATNNEYVDMISNYLYNMRFETCKSTLNVSTPEVLYLNVLDPINIGQTDVGGNTYLTTTNSFISAKTIMIEPQNYKVDYAIKSINL